MQRDLFSFEPDWYEPLRAIRSLGSQAPSIAHQGELAASRRQHLGQFFTPDAIAAFMWSFVSGWNDNRLIRILDNSVGSGRLLQYADPERHAVYGVDVHADVIQHCQKVFEDAGFIASSGKPAWSTSIRHASISRSSTRRSRSTSNHRICRRSNARRGAGTARTPAR
jgi:hypothetical protein